MKTFDNIDFSKYKQEFIEKLGDISKWPEIPEVCGKGYPPNSIFLSEALVIYSLCKEFNINLLLESGVFRGGSTRIWSKVLSNIQIKCIDILESPRHKPIVEKLSQELLSHGNIEFIIGDGNIELPKLIKENPKKNIGVFIDGPKDEEGFILCNKTLEYDNVIFSSLHDFSSFNNDKCFSSMNNIKFRKEIGDIDSTHPQIQKYPEGPGLYCILQ